MQPNHRKAARGRISSKSGERGGRSEPQAGCYGAELLLMEAGVRAMRVDQARKLKESSGRSSLTA